MVTSANNNNNKIIKLIKMNDSEMMITIDITNTSHDKIMVVMMYILKSRITNIMMITISNNNITNNNDNEMMIMKIKLKVIFTMAMIMKRRTMRMMIMMMMIEILTVATPVIRETMKPMIRMKIND